jgi:hypothetical protein
MLTPVSPEDKGKVPDKVGLTVVMRQTISATRKRLLEKARSDTAKVESRRLKASRESKGDAFLGLSRHR